MATITTNTFLDGGTARTAGETWTMNGGVLTIRTDSRWHANAPASMTGSHGSMTISSTLGGGILLDARNVRWMPYDTGTGNVPAIGTTVSQGGVSGYLLGVWSALNAAPTAVGAAMPASGFIKFREVTGGNFAAGALSGIGASATGPDVTGWMEVVFDQATAITVPRLGYFRARGNWFYLDNTNGSANQIIQIPTNGGGAGTRVPAVWIETSPGSNTYEMFPAVGSTWFITANLGTDYRSKFVLMDTDGRIRIGSDGTNNVGFVPASGCKIRIPNILGRQCTTGARATNTVPHATLATRPDFTTTAAGEIDCEFLMDDWYHLFSSPYKVRFVNCATMDIHSTANEASPTELDNYVTGVYQTGSIPLTMSSNLLGGTIKDCKFFRPDASSNGHSFSMTVCQNHEFQGQIHTGVITFARSSGTALFTQCRNIIQTGDFIKYNQQLNIVTCFNMEFEKITHEDRLVGTTNTTSGVYLTAVSASADNIKINNVSFGSIANNHPYLGVISYQNSTNIICRNGGTAGSPIGGATNAPAYIAVDSTNNDGIKIQNINLTATRTGIFTSSNTSKNVTLENLRGTVGASVITSVNTLVKGCRSASNSVTGQSSVYGSHFFDMFYTDTTGGVILSFNEPTAFSAANYEATLGTGAGFTSAGNLVMPNADDTVTFTMPYFATGHTGFALSPVLTVTNPSNFNYEYDIDTGTGFSGTFKSLIKSKTRSAGGTVGTNTVTLTATASEMPAIGDYAFTEAGNQIPAGTTVTNVVGQVVTLSANITTATLGQVHFMKDILSEIISPVNGFKLKIRATAKVAETTNALTFIRLTTSTTLVDQTSNNYPLDVFPPTEITLTGLKPNSEIRVYEDNAGENDTYITGIENSGTSFTFSVDRDTVINIMINNLNYLPADIWQFTVPDTNSILPIVQFQDRQYFNPA